MTNNIFFMCLGGAILMYGLWRWYSIRKFKTWVSVEAKLIKAQMESRITSMKGVRGQCFTPAIEFEYVVSGKIYRSTKFSAYNFTIGIREELDDITNGANVGDAIRAYYNPADERQAILRIPDYSGALILVFTGGIMLLLVIFINVVGK